ncbi:hypothetical protein [Kineococcus rubinsiae]|uniref:hypothetical protein n=1 Tax=Kineococcus rubinsiae TaxID=2609562 RepID=UPI0014305DD0|nr:hypothetical protein [Kineococcus rubinsiae]NIZ92817.1 hypothetical protein [Kineococcus rubinsiae]
MARNPAVTDEQLTRALGIYAGMVGHVLGDPGRWLGVDDDPPPSATFPRRAADAVRDRALGKTRPGSREWAAQPLQRRVDWWVTRIGISAGLAAAAPRFAGALSDRVPLQAALGASAAGLAVCATAREHGRTAPADWVPLLAEVLFERKLPRAADAVPADGEAARRLEASDEDGAAAADDSADDGGRLAGAQRAARTVWRLARALLGVTALLDERPRGGFLPRVIGKLPVVGVAGGWLDERSGIRKASRETAALLR